MLSTDQRTYELVGRDYPGNRAVDVKNPSLGWITWMAGFLFVVSFVGPFSLIALRKVVLLIISLHYASSTCTWLLEYWLVTSCQCISMEL